MISLKNLTPFFYTDRGGFIRYVKHLCRRAKIALSLIFLITFLLSFTDLPLLYVRLIVDTSN